MAFTYQTFDTTPANLVADLKTKILLSSDYSNPSGNVVKATTPLGAQIVMDLTGAAAPTVQCWTPYVYRTYSGSTGVDLLNGYYLYYKAAAAGAVSTVPLHVTLYAGPTLLYVSIEGPRFSESFCDSTSTGSLKQTVWVSQLTPYHGADTTPTVVCGGSSSYPGYNTPAITNASLFCRVGQNQSAGASWVTASLSALHFPGDMDRYETGWTPRASDGSLYLSPYVVFEQVAGIRGRLTDLYYAGVNRALNNSDQSTPFAPGEVVTIGSNSYRIENPYRASGNTGSMGALGAFYNQGNVNGDYGRSPLVAVRAV